MESTESFHAPRSPHRHGLPPRVTRHHSGTFTAAEDLPGQHRHRSPRFPSAFTLSARRSLGSDRCSACTHRCGFVQGTFTALRRLLLRLLPPPSLLPLATTYPFSVSIVSRVPEHRAVGITQHGAAQACFFHSAFCTQVPSRAPQGLTARFPPSPSGTPLSGGTADCLFTSGGPSWFLPSFGNMSEAAINIHMQDFVWT